MDFVSIRRAAALVLLFVSAAASAQAPAGRAGETVGPAPEPTDADLLSPPRGGESTLTRVGAWPYGPTYAIANGHGGLLVGQGRMLRGAGTRVEMPGLIRDIQSVSDPQPNVSTVFVATSHATDTQARGLFVLRFGPGSREIVGRLVGGTVLAVEVVQNGPQVTAYLARFSPALGSYALSIVDVSDPTAPALIGEVALGGVAQGIAVLGPTVYVAGGDAGVYVIDASAPAVPTVVRTIEAGAYDRRLDVDGSGTVPLLAVASGSYTTGTGSVTTFRLDDPLAPTVLGQYQSPTVVEDVGWMRHLFSPVLSAYAAATYAGVIQLDAGASLLDSGTYEGANLVSGANRILTDVSGTDSRIVIVGDYYYGVVRYEGSLLFPELVSAGKSFSYGTLTDTADPATVYVAGGAYGVARLRAEPDGRLVETGRAHDEAWNFTYAVAQNATHLYVADGFSGVHVVPKATMQRVRTLPVPSFTNYVAVSQDGLTLFVDEGDRVAVYALANPDDPVRRATLNVEADGIAAPGDVVYVGEASGSDVRVFRLSGIGGSGGPVQTATLATAGPNVAVALDGGRLYAYGGPTDVSVFDASTPTVPVLVGTVPTAGGSGFDMDRGIVYVGGAAGLEATDARDPAAPVVLATYNAGRAGAILGVEATPGTVYLSEGAVGVERIAADLAVAAAPAAPAAEALAVAPNPTAGRTVVTFALAEASVVRADVVDVLGRRVAVLASGPAAAGPQRLVWDGRDAGGRRAAPGVYVVRVEAAGRVQSRRVTVVR